MARILIVDDEKDLQILIHQRFRKKIQDKSFEFIFAHNGLEALEALKSQQPVDILVTDIHMPGMDGLTLLSKLPLYSPQTRSIVLSAYDDIQNLRRAMNYGAYDFMTKPLNFMEFEDILARSLQQRNPAALSLEKTSISSVEKEKRYFETFEKDFFQTDLSVFSILSLKPLFPASDSNIILDFFAAEQGYALLAVIADDDYALSKLSLIKIRDVLRAFSLSKPDHPNDWIKSLQPYQKKFIQSNVAVMVAWVNLSASKVKMACFPEEVFFLQEHKSPLKQALKGNHPIFLKETVVLYESRTFNKIIPLISFNKKLPSC